MKTAKSPDFGSVDDVARFNASQGFHFFDSDTMRLFGTRIQGDLIAGRWFVTSDKRAHDYEGRGSTIRFARDNGRISELGEFLQFDIPSKAFKALEKARKAGVRVKHDPYDHPGITDPESPDGFNWRCYVGDLPLGERTTLREAREIAREAHPNRFHFAASNRAKVFHRSVPDFRGGGHTPERPKCGAQYTAAVVGPLNSATRYAIETGAAGAPPDGLRPCPKCFGDGETDLVVLMAAARGEFDHLDEADVEALEIGADYDDHELQNEQRAWSRAEQKLRDIAPELF